MITLLLASIIAAKYITLPIWWWVYIWVLLFLQTVGIILKGVQLAIEVKKK